LSKFINILAIDTATDACSVALSVSGQITESFEIAPRAHSIILFPMIDKILKQSGMRLQEIDAFAFGRGPGSFTGLRIAASVIQGFGVALSKPLIPVSTLRAIAQAAYRKEGHTQIFASLDAKMGEIYWGLFASDTQGLMQPYSEERVQAPNTVQYPHAEWQAVQDYPHAQDIAYLAQAEYVLGNVVSPEKALPVYIRDKVTS
jgi:tRNA threonylcarbamoyladenosine biosynthesis protein TsaB